MLGIIATVYGLVTLITGKFWLGKGRKAVGNPARIAGACLLAVWPVGFALGFALATVGVNLGAIAWGLDLALLAAGFVAAFTIASKAAKAQETQAQFASPAQQSRAAA